MKFLRQTLEKKQTQKSTYFLTSNLRHFCIYVVLITLTMGWSSFTLAPNSFIKKTFQQVKEKVVTEMPSNSRMLMEDCSDCSNATCTTAPITDQATALNSINGVGANAGCNSSITREVVEGDTETFCATFTTPATLEEGFVSFFGSIPNSNAGCDASSLSNWQMYNNCTLLPPASFTTIAPHYPRNTPRPAWQVSPNTNYEVCYDVTVVGPCSDISDPCFAPHWVAAPCELTVSTSNIDCSRNDGTYDVIIDFDNGGQGAGTYIITNNGGGLISGDDPNLVVSGTIVLGGVTDGDGYNVEIEGNQIDSGCNFDIVSNQYRCTACPKIVSSTVASDECQGNTVTLSVEVDEGVEGENFYIQWYKDGVAINDTASASFGLDGIYGNEDDPPSAMNYEHTLEFDGGPQSCSFEDHIFTARLYCRASVIMEQGDINTASTTESVVANYNAVTETCIGVDLSTLPDDVLAEDFSYQYRVTSGPPFGQSWICEAVLGVTTPAGNEGPFCHPYWLTLCPTEPGGAGASGGPNARTCTGGPGNSAGTNLNPAAGPEIVDLGGINSTTPAKGVWNVCVFDTYNDTNGSTEGVLNYIFMEVNFFLPPGENVNFPATSIVDAVNITEPKPMATSPVTDNTHPNGEGKVTTLRICNAPVEGDDYTLPDFNNCETNITPICPEAVIKYSNDNGATYLLDDPPGLTENGKVVYYQILTENCETSCNVTGTYTLTCLSPPTITSINTATFLEETAVDTVAIDVDAIDDADTERWETLNYALTAGGDDNALFRVEPATGEIFFLSSPDFQTPQDLNGDNDYDLEVEVCDQTALCDTQLVVITVEKINEAPTITSYGGNPTGIQNIDENTTAVANIETIDDFDSEGAGLTYSITGADASLFQIDNDGVLSLIAPLNAEDPQQSGPNPNEYAVTVIATDASGLTDQLALIVVIDDVCEALAPSVSQD